MSRARRHHDALDILWRDRGGVSVGGGQLASAAADAPLADAMEKMDRAAVRALLQRRADVNAPQVDGMTALHWAAYQDDVESVELLVRAGANVKATNRYGVAPLTLAITNGNAPWSTCC